MELRREDSGSRGVLVVKGEMNINRSQDLRNLLIESLASTDCVSIDVEGVTEMDLSCLQLLCSAHRTARGMSKRLTLSGNGSKPFRQFVKAAGFSREKNCGAGGNEPCLWVGGE